MWPAILLGRRLVSLLKDLEIVVSAEKVLSRDNLAHHIAKSEMQYRRESGWGSSLDHWPEPLPPAFQEVWRCVARSRISSERDTLSGFLTRGRGLNAEVSSALDILARSASS